MPKTALYDRHVQLGARMVDFAGWELPVQYPTGPKEEHLCVRSSAGVFDIDHMGQIRVTGPDSVAFLQRVMTSNLANLGVGRAKYSLICYEDGGIVDDVFIYRLPGFFFVVVNASNREKDIRWLNYHVGALDVQVTDVSDETYMLALQGPKSQAILQRLCGDDLGSLRRHAIMETHVRGVGSLVGRTGYTGEDGFELYFSAQDALRLWDAILDAGRDDGLIPVGLAARDTLRIEPAMPLYGQEITADTNPIEAGLAWAVALEKSELVARESLLKVSLEGPARRLIGFRMTERGVPRHGYDILLDGEPVGSVTSGAFSPTLGEFIGLGYVPASSSQVGTEIAIDVRGRARGAIIVPKPFYRRH